MLLVASLTTQSKLQNSVNLGKKAVSNTEGMQISKKLVNTRGLHSGAISTNADNVIMLSLFESQGVTTKSISIYAPAQHPHGTVHETKAEAEAEHGL
jgi:hypothetical protein